MALPLDDLATAVQALVGLWPRGADGAGVIEGTASGDLIAINAVIGTARRLLDAAASQVAAEVARQSRPELGRDSLAKKQGFRNATTLLSATLGTTGGDAARLVQVGNATAPRMLLTGETAPAKYPHVATEIAAGRIGAAAASAIIAMLDRVVMRAGIAAVDHAEQALATQAAGLTLDQLAKVLARAEAYLDPDGVQPREDELRSQRSLHIRRDRDGMIVLTAKLDPEHAAPVKNVIEAMVTAELQAQRDAVACVSPGGGGDGDGGGDGNAPVAADLESPRRSIAQMQADALVRVCEHLLGCDHRDTPLPGATVVVRVSLDDLRSGTGHATIDGIDTPICIGTARRMAADAGVIPLVLGGDSDILDWGRQKRLFTAAQKRALVERDGGCAHCGAPPGMAKVHHIRWWKRDAGPTDLRNGILLCDACHHLIHDDGWEIRIDGTGVEARVWFIPPPYLDPLQRPRLGGRRRFDYIAA
ncbi:DUF222 domain-containing protein [Microbacterium sp. W1N]|uniref:HNH endonuclease n=1 Tax=Microbacterium festucae TaxID=2977531 RepID=UPI0021C0982B|nr:DUF222 domain-containing protein [Microbacterium festucae]MCT9821619.1 DUF222 domain-containing protein [Microbacterium festucae]